MSVFQKVLNFPLVRYYLLAWRRFADYKGVSNRREYWWGILSAIIFSAIVLVSLFLLFSESQAVVILVTLFLTITKFVFLPLNIRRLRDTGDIKGKKSDLIYYLLIGFSLLTIKGNAFFSIIKFINGVFLLALYTKPSIPPADYKNITERE